MIVNCIAIIGIGICIGENLLLGIGIGSVVIFLYRWNPNLVLCDIKYLYIAYHYYSIHFVSRYDKLPRYINQHVVMVINYKCSSYTHNYKSTKKNIAPLNLLEVSIKENKFYNLSCNTSTLQIKGAARATLCSPASWATTGQ